MLKERIISLINNPHLTNKEDNKFLEDISEKYPYFSISHILLSKGLLNTESLRYNRKLKQAALYSLDRKQLFKLITQHKKDSSEIIKTKGIKVIKSEDLPTFKDTKTELKIGEPLEFDETEEHSFSEWLALTKVKKIQRIDTKKEESELIDSFIETQPTIKAEKNKFFSPTETAKTSLIENNELVTETLARVYLEQEHFNKAIQAYKKLSLKYPKKSSFFADQINLINDLKKK
jgi:predicted Zn-dependent protease